jgi:antitoxin HigA-1
MFFINMQAHYDAELTRDHIAAELDAIEHIA